MHKLKTAKPPGRCKPASLKTFYPHNGPLLGFFLFRFVFLTHFSLLILLAIFWCTLLALASLQFGLGDVGFEEELTEEHKVAEVHEG